MTDSIQISSLSTRPGRAYILNIGFLIEDPILAWEKRWSRILFSFADGSIGVIYFRSFTDSLRMKSPSDAPSFCFLIKQGEQRTDMKSCVLQAGKVSSSYTYQPTLVDTKIDMGYKASKKKRFNKKCRIYFLCLDVCA